MFLRHKRETLSTYVRKTLCSFVRKLVSVSQEEKTGSLYDAVRRLASCVLLYIRVSLAKEIPEIK